MTELEIIPLDSIQPDSRNANRGSERGTYMLRRSLEKLGAGRSILLDKHGRIIAGNKTAESAADVGLDDLIIVRTRGDKLVAVMREDLDLDDPTGQARELAYADNRTSQISLDWDAGIIADDIAQGVDLGDWFMGFELEDMGAVEKPEEQDAAPQIDRAEELREQWGVETGQMWRMASRTEGQEHRLICGDARVPTVIKQLDCNDVAVLLTDPPYSSGGFQEAQRKSGSIGNRQNIKIAADQLSTRGYISLMSEVLALVPADVLYMFTDWRMWSWTYDIAERANFPVRNMLVWDKGRMGMGFPWRSTHELILFAKRTSSQMMDGKTGNVLRFDRASNDDHPTEKPVELVQHILENTPGGAVYDPFGGSGTTMIACENLGRVCRMAEISPSYCAVALQRYSDAFGITPELVADTVD